MIWRPPSQSELTPMIFNIGLTHSGSEASICSIVSSLIFWTNKIHKGNFTKKIQDMFFSEDQKFDATEKRKFVLFWNYDSQPSLLTQNILDP